MENRIPSVFCSYVIMGVSTVDVVMKRLAYDVLDWKLTRNNVSSRHLLFVVAVCVD